MGKTSARDAAFVLPLLSSLIKAVWYQPLRHAHAEAEEEFAAVLAHKIAIGGEDGFIGPSLVIVFSRLIYF
jgi:hypothetical protein